MKIISMLVAVAIMLFLVTMFLKVPGSSSVAPASDANATVTTDDTDVDSAIDDSKPKVESNRKEASKTLAGRNVLRRFNSVGKALDKTDEHNQKVLDEVSE